MSRAIPEEIWGALCVYAEARGEPYEGQVAVGNVIRSRARERFCSDGSILSTIAWPKQFSWMNDADSQRSHVLSVTWDDPAFRTAFRAWLESEHRQEVGPEVLWYHAESVQPWWSKAQSIQFVVQISKHLFYRKASQ